MKFKVTYDWDDDTPQSAEFENVTGILKKDVEVSKKIKEGRSVSFGSDPLPNDYEIKL